MSETVNRAISQMFLLMHSQSRDCLFKLNLAGLLSASPAAFWHFNYDGGGSCIFHHDTLPWRDFVSSASQEVIPYCKLLYVSSGHLRAVAYNGALVQSVSVYWAAVLTYCVGHACRSGYLSCGGIDIYLSVVGCQFDSKRMRHIRRTHVPPVYGL